MAESRPLRTTRSEAQASTRTLGPRGRLRLAYRRHAFGYALILPALVVIAIVIAYPVVDAIRISFMSDSLIQATPSRYIGTANYRNVWDDPVFQKALRNTAIWTAWNVVLQVALGTALALLLNERLRARGLFRAIALIPWVVPSVAAALIFRYLYDPSSGLVNAVAQKLGLIDSYVPWLGQTSTAMPAVIGESVWKGTPFVMILMLAALQTVPGELYEAAAIDGADRGARFRHVVLPHVRPTLGLATILTIVYTVNNFNAIWLMTKGGPLHGTDIVFTYAYTMAFSNYDFGVAAAMSVMLFAALLLIGLLYVLLVERDERRLGRS